MLLRALRWPQQRYLLARFRGAVDEARLEAACDAGERLLDLGPTASGYEDLLRPVDHAGSPTAHLQRYDFLRELERDERAGRHPWRLLLRVALLDRLGWQTDALALSAEFARLRER